MFSVSFAQHYITHTIHHLIVLDIVIVSRTSDSDLIIEPLLWI